MGVSVVVLTSDSALQKALTSRLERLQPVVMGHDPGDPPASTEIVVTTVSECEPERCGRLTSKGAMVIVLAAIPREGERERYLQSGAAAYVPMSVDSAELLAEIQRLAPRIDRVLASPVACHGLSTDAAGAGK